MEARGWTYDAHCFQRVPLALYRPDMIKGVEEPEAYRPHVAPYPEMEPTHGHFVGVDQL